MPNVYIKKPHHKQEQTSSCIPACVKIMLEFFGIKLSESELRLKLKTKPSGTHIINIFTLNDEPYGIYSTIEFWSLTQLKAYLEKSKLPCIVMLWTEYLNHWDSECLHSVVVHGFDDSHIIINDPNFTQKEFYVPFEDFLNAWQINDGLVILFNRSNDKNEK